MKTLQKNLLTNLKQHIFSYRKLYEQQNEIMKSNNPIFSTAVFCNEKKIISHRSKTKTNHFLLQDTEKNQQRITKRITY